MKTTIAAALAVALLAGCGTRSDDKASATATSASTSSPTSTSAIRPDGQYATIDQLRAAVQEAGIQCPDQIWEPVPAPTITQAVGEGKCGNDLTLVVTTPEGVPAANSALTNRYLTAYLGGDKTELTFVEGATWVAMGNANATSILVSRLGAKQVQGAA